MSGRVSSDVVVYGVLGLAFAIIVAVLGSALVVVLSLRRTWTQQSSLTRTNSKQNDVRYGKTEAFLLSCLNSPG